MYLEDRAPVQWVGLGGSNLSAGGVREDGGRPVRTHLEPPLSGGCGGNCMHRGLHREVGPGLRERGGDGHSEGLNQRGTQVSGRGQRACLHFKAVCGEARRGMRGWGFASRA